MRPNFINDIVSKPAQLPFCGYYWLKHASAVLDACIRGGGCCSAFLKRQVEVPYFTQYHDPTLLVPNYVHFRTPGLAFGLSDCIQLYPQSHPDAGTRAAVVGCLQSMWRVRNDLHAVVLVVRARNLLFLKSRYIPHASYFLPILYSFLVFLHAFYLPSRIGDV